MLIQNIVKQFGVRRKCGLVFAAGGSADIILAKAIAGGLVEQGCARIDLAQPLNCKALSDKRLLSDLGELYALIAEDGLCSELVLKHHRYVSAGDHSDHLRGKGLSISSSLQWDHGSRYVCAAHGGGPALLASRLDSNSPFYDFAVGVDGGGDVLTHGEDEFDRIVVSGFKDGWHASNPLVLIAMGLGADGGSAPEAFDDVSLIGWHAVGRAEIEQEFADDLHRELEQLCLWHSSPISWTADDTEWGYGFKVPQIIAMAARGEYPFAAPGNSTDVTLFPRRGALTLMSKKLLREARLYRAR